MLSLPERELEFPSWEGLGWVSDTEMLSDSATHPLPLPGGELGDFAAKNLPLKGIWDEERGNNHVFHTRLNLTQENYVLLT